MVICCVPDCGIDSWKCDGSVTFYDFPTNPDLKAKWIKQINSAFQSNSMWIPRGRPVICSKHFLHTDFRNETDALKPRCIPTVFGHRYIGPNPESNDSQSLEPKKSPLIVKVLGPQTSAVVKDGSGLPEDSSQANPPNHDELDAESDVQISETDADKSPDISENISNLDPDPSFYNNNKNSSKTNGKPAFQKSTNMHYAVQPSIIITSVTGATAQNSFSNNTTSNNVPKTPPSSITKTASSSVTKTGPSSITKTALNNITKTTSSSIPITPSSSIPKTPASNISKTPSSSIPKTTSTTPKQPIIFPKKKQKDSNDLIEIGPNTFLKINPDVIKVNKKQTPSGNTVLQFVMDQKFAKNYTCDLLPKIIQGFPGSSNQKQTVINNAQTQSSDENNTTASVSKSQSNKESVQHVLGHVVDNHVCEESCVDLTLEEDDTEVMDITQSDENSSNILPDSPSAGSQGKCDQSNSDPTKDSSKVDEKSCMEKAPVLLTTNMPLSHCFIDRPKYILQLKQKNKQIASLKVKLGAMSKKIEELEDRCIVQERQLSYSFIKRLKNIRKSAAKGDPSATYILEQIRSYNYANNSKMRWSDSTLTQCAIWCRKAPYAYEYFKKANFFKLPCLGTVKRFMKKHPEIKFHKPVPKSTPQENNNNNNEDDDDSSSDFEFDESDGQNDNGMSEDENTESVTCENLLSGITDSSNQKDNIKDQGKTNGKNEVENATESISTPSEEVKNQSNVNNDGDKETDSSNVNNSSDVPITVDTSNLELQEIVLPSGEVLQCYSSNIVTGGESGQYFIIPNISDANSAGNHEYNVVPADSMPVFLQNIENSQLHVQQDQLIFIANSSDHVESTEAAVSQT